MNVLTLFGWSLVAVGGYVTVASVALLWCHSWAQKQPDPYDVWGEDGDD
ncbi:hypothetical protein [Nonomuraea sp. GTA35]